jgi:hypothetical protein
MLPIAKQAAAGGDFDSPIAARAMSAKRPSATNAFAAESARMYATSGPPGDD